jgi:hypothetical protein
VEDARRAEGWSVRRKPTKDGRVAPKGRTRYFLFQPSLPLTRRLWLGAHSCSLHACVPLSHLINNGTTSRELYAHSAVCI